MPPTPRPRVAVAGDQVLVCEAIRAALSSRGHETVGVGWPGARVPDSYLDPELLGGLATQADVGLMVVGLDRPGRLVAAAGILEAPIPWVVLADPSTAAIWGAVYERGAVAVLPSTSSLDEVSGVLDAALVGTSTPSEHRSSAIDRWHEFVAASTQSRRLISTMTPREREVLCMLWTGDTVASIATQFHVSQSTVRSQVKTVLRKLQVNSQLAAVALLDSMLQGWPEIAEQVGVGVGDPTERLLASIV